MSTPYARHRASSRIRVTDRRRRIGLAAAATGIAVAGLLSAPAFAGTTVSPSEPGSPGNPPVVRQNMVTVTAATGAQFYYRVGSNATTASNTAFNDLSQGLFLAAKSSGRACVGNNPAGKNNSPRDTITVTGPGSTPTVVGAPHVSPVRNTNASGAPAANPQPAPADGNYLGDFPGTGGNHGFSFQVDMTGQPAGTYTVTTVTQSMTKTDLGSVFSVTSPGPCVIGHPDSTNKGVVPGPQTSTTTFEYRPWQNTFVDVFGGGKVFANAVPNEFQFTVGTKSSAITGAGYQKFYTLPGLTSFSLPSDPAACAENPASCLPSAAIACDPSTGCIPRIMMINEISGSVKLQGTFDLQTKAFIALANINGTQRVLMSLGTANDATYHALLLKLQAAAAAQHIDLATLLATQVRLRTGQYETTLSLLDGLLIAPSTAPGGLQIVTDTTVQAGVIFDLYLDLTSNSCTSRTVDSTTAPDSYKPTSPVGYTVTKTALPSVPAVGALGAIAGGPVYHITGKFNAGLANTASAVVGVDTAADEPNGYPVWIEPFVAAGHVASPKTMDFLGTATWSASETSFGSSCFITDAMLGTGVALYNNPLPVGLGTLLDPLGATSATDALNAQIDAAVQTVVTTVTTNPAVASVLTSLVGSLGL